jgi:hypothetical protein
VLSSNPNMQKEEGYNDDTNHVYKKALLEDFSIKMDTLAVAPPCLSSGPDLFSYQQILQHRPPRMKCTTFSPPSPAKQTSKSTN